MFFTGFVKWPDFLQQNPKNGMREEFQTNIFCNIILGANIKNAIDNVGKYFQLTEEEKDTIVLCGDDEDARPGGKTVTCEGSENTYQI